MEATKAAGDAILNTPEWQKKTAPPRWGMNAARLALGTVIILESSGLTELSPAATAIANWTDDAKINLSLTAGATLAAQEIARFTMKLLETMMGPIIRAQREDAAKKVAQEKDAEHKAEMERWKARQLKAGAILIPDDQLPEVD